VGKLSKKKTVEPMKVCSKCKKDKKLIEYYMSSSTLIHSDGCISICKQCLWKLIDFEDKASLLKILAEINRPFLQDMYVSARNSDRQNKTGEYMRLLGMKQNRELTFRDSILGEEEDIQIKRVETDVKLISDRTDDEVKEIIGFWGNGYSMDDYLFLQKEYETLLNSYESDSYAIQMLFQEVSHQRLSIKHKREKGEGVDKELKTLQDLLTSSNIKPVQETGAQATEQQTFGTLIKKFEEERPIPEPDEEWKDVNGIRKYIDVWFKGHLMRMLGKENDTENEYKEEVEQYTVKPPTYEGDDL